MSAGIPRGTVLMDAGYGADTKLRTAITELGLTYAAGIQPHTSVWRPGEGPLPPKPWSGRGRPTSQRRRDAEHQPVKVKDLALGLPASAWETVTLCANDRETNATRTFTRRGREDQIMPMPTLTPVAEDEIVPASENGRRPTMVPPPVTASPELSGRPRRRSFTAQEKLRILADAVAHLRAIGETAPENLLAHTSPVGWEHIAFSGDFLWDRAAAIPPGRRALNIGRSVRQAA